MPGPATAPDGIGRSLFLNGKQLPTFSKCPNPLLPTQRCVVTGVSDGTGRSTRPWRRQNAIVEVWLPSEIRNPFTWTIVVVDHRKHFFVAGSEFCYGHESILAEGFPERAERRRKSALWESRAILNLAKAGVQNGLRPYDARAKKIYRRIAEHARLLTFVPRSRWHEVIWYDEDE